MRRILRYFFEGLLILLPVGLTAYVIVWSVVWLDGWANDLLERAFHWRCTGAGVPLALGAVFLAGFLMDLWLFRKVWRLADRTIEKIPVVKSIYSAIRDTLGFLFGEKQSFSNVVLVRMPGPGLDVLGFVTNENPGARTGVDMEGLVGVYVPMAFNLGGYTFFVPRDRMKPVNMSVDEAMTFILSGGVSAARCGEDGA